MEVNSISKPYREFNEDGVVVVKDHLFVVIDTATALGEPFHSPTDGVYLLNKLKEELLKFYKNGKLKPNNFLMRMKQISKKLYKDYTKGIDKELERYQFPNASIAVCYVDGIKVHIFSIGDASTFVRLKNNKSQYISDKSIPLMDREVVKYYHSKGVNQFNEMYEILRKNRSLLNKNGRRCTFSLYKNPHFKFKHYIYDIRKIDQIYLCSDGYYEAFDTFKLFKSRRELFSNKNDLQDVYKKIFEIAHKDKDMVLYPRLKIIDDITAIRITF